MMLNFLNQETQQQIQDCLDLLNKVLGPDLLGVYLYGSALVGGLQKYSDLDLLVVSERATTYSEKTQLIARLLQISGVYMQSSKLPLEMTLIVKSEVNPWRYPPFFDFQYGDWLRKSFEMGLIEPWATYEMPDLALLITQVLLMSQTLYGLEPEQVLANVPYGDFIKAMLHDLDRLIIDLDHDTRNILLTYARIWSTLSTNVIRSKPAAADWAMQRLPKQYQSVMQRAKSICSGAEKDYWDDIHELVEYCSYFMIDQINKQRSSLDLDSADNMIVIQK